MLTPSLEEKIQNMCVINGWTLSVAESCTGGTIASRLTRVSGASQYFLGGVVSYCNEMKERLLHVSSDLIKAKGAVSEEVAIQMVLGIIQTTNSEFGLAVTGIAGPTGGTPEKPVGTIWVAVARRGAKPVTLQLKLEGQARAFIIEQSSIAALQALLSFMSGKTIE